jgi:hypothetical protein
MKYKFLSIAAISIAVIILLVAAMNRDDSTDFLQNRAMITVRSIGHQLLQANHDSTSLIMPVKELTKGIFQLEFENKFSFEPDTLVQIVRSNLQTIELPVNYLVNVFDCDSHEIVYAFEVNPKKTDIIPCLGRVQPSRCYSIQIAFVDFASQKNSASIYLNFAMVFACLGLVILIGGGMFEKKQGQPLVSNSIIIGQTTFFPESRKLQIETEIIELSEKETRLLRIFAKQPNQLILREQFLKEVWEDEGVITGRSLDMFISKLRKKLKDDPTIALVNVHGQGYKLEVL